MKSILLVKKFLGLVEMRSGLVNASFCLPEWQAENDFLYTLWNLPVKPVNKKIIGVVVQTYPLLDMLLLSHIRAVFT